MLVFGNNFQEKEEYCLMIHEECIVKGNKISKSKNFVVLKKRLKVFSWF